jgi:hypothetical protein
LAAFSKFRWVSLAACRSASSLSPGVLGDPGIVIMKGIAGIGGQGPEVWIAGGEFVGGMERIPLRNGGEDGVDEDVDDAAGEGVDGGFGEARLFQGTHLGEVALAAHEVLKVVGIDFTVGEEERRAFEAFAGCLQEVARVVAGLSGGLSKECLAELFALAQDVVEDAVEVHSSELVGLGSAFADFQSDDLVKSVGDVGLLDGDGVRPERAFFPPATKEGAEKIAAWRAEDFPLADCLGIQIAPPVVFVGFVDRQRDLLDLLPLRAVGGGGLIHEGESLGFSRGGFFV